MTTTDRHACDITLRGDISIEEIEQRAHMQQHQLEQGAESDAIAMLRRHGPMPRWQLTRLVMECDHDAHRANRAVKLLIISQRVLYEAHTRKCSLPSGQPRGLMASLKSWLF